MRCREYEGSLLALEYLGSESGDCIDAYNITILMEDDAEVTIRCVMSSEVEVVCNDD